jgi:hypothetical protein
VDDELVTASSNDFQSNLDNVHGTSGRWIQDDEFHSNLELDSSNLATQSGGHSLQSSAGELDGMLESQSVSWI